MTRLIITGRNNSMPRDVAQSMAYLMPRSNVGPTTIAFRPGADLEAEIARYMRVTGTTNQAAAIRALLQKALAS
jgi:hypothetical protein